VCKFIPKYFPPPADNLVRKLFLLKKLTVPGRRHVGDKMNAETLEVGTAEFPQQKLFFVRRGLLYTLLATTSFYFASGSSAYTLPVEIPANVAEVWIPLLFLSGIGYTMLASFRPVQSMNEYSAPETAPAPEPNLRGEIIIETSESPLG
jgi:hypothetical protein